MTMKGCSRVLSPTPMREEHGSPRDIWLIRRANLQDLEKPASSDCYICRVIVSKYGQMESAPEFEYIILTVLFEYYGSPNLEVSLYNNLDKICLCEVSFTLEITGALAAIKRCKETVTHADL